MARKMALVTGASSGIGEEIARLHARKGGDLVLVARREAALKALKKELEAAHDGITVHVFKADLAADGAAKKLYDDVTAKGIEVDFLINNAGLGGHGVHAERHLEAEVAMIDLNVTSLVVLTHEFARDMAARGGGRILNVGSTAGFMPGPYQAVYFATKAFVNSFSQAVDEEMREKKVTCTVLAPGYVKTEFAQVADLDGTDLVKGGATAKDVAKVGYDAMKMGQLVAFNQTSLQVMLEWITPLLPRRMVLGMVRKMQAKT